MPDLILEVLGLQLRLPNPEVNSETAAEAATAIGLWCELSPAWDPARAIAFSAAKAVAVGGGHWLEWCNEQDEESMIDDHGTWYSRVRSPPPLVTFLISVPPPGGVASLATNDLHMRLLLPTSGGSLAPASAAPRIEVPLKEMLRTPAGEQVGLRSKEAKDHRSLTAVVWAAWRPAPRGIKQLLDVPLVASLSPKPDHSSRSTGASSVRQSRDLGARPRSARPHSAGATRVAVEPKPPPAAVETLRRKYGLGEGQAPTPKQKETSRIQTPRRYEPGSKKQSRSLHMEPWRPRAQLQLSERRPPQFAIPIR